MRFLKVDKRKAINFDWLLLVTTYFICLIGLAVIYSAGYDPQIESSRAMTKQLVSLGIGSVICLGAILINPATWRKLAWPFFIVGCILLIVVMFKGTVAGGARRWLVIGSFRMQPAEFTKIGLILLFARLFSSDKSPENGFGFKDLILPFILLLIPVGLIAKEPDLGTALCHLLIGSSMLLMAGVKRTTLIRLSIVAAVLAIPSWGMLKDYQKKRVLNFLSPEMDPLGSGYHAIQSKIAVGSGEVFGKGFLQGTQTQLRFLPEQTTDFIFSVLAEEWGFFGSFLIISLYTLLIIRLIKVSSRSADSFSAYVAFGVAAMMFWHVVINIGMVIGVVPVVGVTLKLLSYGGSSLIAALLGIGIVLGISFRRYSFT